MKRTSLISIAIGFAWGLAIQASMAAAEREREREEEIHALERQLLETAIACTRVGAPAREDEEG